MQLKVIGSSSQGNCYALMNESEILILECGIPLKKVKPMIGYRIADIKGCLCSHSHSDHFKYADDFKGCGIKVFAPFNESKLSPKYQFGNFIVKPFKLEHSVPCFGFLVFHPDMGKLLFITDTEYVKYQFPGVDHILIETNYDSKYVQEDAENRSHVYLGHLAIDTACEFLKMNNSDNLKNVVLLHLSQTNADPKEFLSKARIVVSCNTYIASKGLEIDLER